MLRRRDIDVSRSRSSGRLTLQSSNRTQLLPLCLAALTTGLLSGISTSAAAEEPHIKQGADEPHIEQGTDEPHVEHDSSAWTTTLYGARMSSETGWEDILLDPVESEYVDVFLAAAALSRPYAHYQDGALSLEAEGQVVKYFGDQDHWELNVVPLVLRWHRFPWSERIATSAAFGLGLSYATELPPVEVEIEGESAQLLIYWVLELTAGPTDAPWSVSLRMHHRSVSYGLMADEGGMNAVGLGLRYRFGGDRRPALTD